MEQGRVCGWGRMWDWEDERVGQKRMWVGKNMVQGGVRARKGESVGHD